MKVWNLKQAIQQMDGRAGCRSWDKIQFAEEEEKILKEKLIIVLRPTG